MRNYTVRLSNSFEAESMEDAAQRFREYIVEGGWSVLVTDDATGDSDDL